MVFGNLANLLLGAAEKRPRFLLTGLKFKVYYFVMKRTFVLAILLAMLVAGLFMARAVPTGQMSVTLAWDASPDPTVTQYYIYYGVASQSYTNKTGSGGLTQLTVSNLLVGVTYYFMATAANSANLESDPSNEISYSVPQVVGVPGAPVLPLIQRIK